jgi:hypothetical protein
VVSQLIAVRPLGAGCGMRDRWSTGRLEAFSDGVFADNRPSLTTRTGFLPIQRFIGKRPDGPARRLLIAQLRRNGLRGTQMKGALSPEGGIYLTQATSGAPRENEAPGSAPRDSSGGNRPAHPALGDPCPVRCPTQRRGTPQPDLGRYPPHLIGMA